MIYLKELFYSPIDNNGVAFFSIRVSNNEVRNALSFRLACLH